MCVVHVCALMQQLYLYTRQHAHIALYCSLLCGGVIQYVICAAAILLTCSQQHVVDVLAVASLGICSAAAWAAQLIEFLIAITIMDATIT